MTEGPGFRIQTVTKTFIYAAGRGHYQISAAANPRTLAHTDPYLRRLLRTFGFLVQSIKNYS